MILPLFHNPLNHHYSQITPGTHSPRRVKSSPDALSTSPPSHPLPASFLSRSPASCSSEEWTHLSRFLIGQRLTTFFAFSCSGNLTTPSRRRAFLLGFFRACGLRWVRWRTSWPCGWAHRLSTKASVEGAGVGWALGNNSTFLWNFNRRTSVWSTSSPTW